MGIILGFSLALLVPILFLSLIRKFDFYQIGQYHIILKCLFWGGIAYVPATFTNWALVYLRLANTETIINFVAPIQEEIFKGLILLYLVRRGKITYSIDGALYGFAIGTGFAVIENFGYVHNNLSEATTVAAQRIFSANLVHAFSSATIGTALGIFRLDTAKLRWQIPAIGLFLAIVQHMFYNNIERNEINPVVTFVPGLLGILFIYYIMQRGKKQARAWIKQKLGMDDRVTRSEVKAVDRLASTDEVLLPVFERFGAETATQVEKLLYLQARLGIKRKTLDSLQNNEMVRNAVETEMREMRTEMETVRRAIGMYAMLFVRGLFTEEMVSVWDQMQVKIQERSAATGNQKGGGLWSSLEERIKPPTENERLD